MGPGEMTNELASEVVEVELVGDEVVEVLPQLRRLPARARARARTRAHARARGNRRRNSRGAAPPSVRVRAKT